jgi:hypothetical protein
MFSTEKSLMFGALADSARIKKILASKPRLAKIFNEKFEKLKLLPRGTAELRTARKNLVNTAYKEQVIDEMGKGWAAKQKGMPLKDIINPQSILPSTEETKNMLSKVGFIRKK